MNELWKVESDKIANLSSDVRRIKGEATIRENVDLQECSAMSESPEISIPTLCCPGISGGADGAGAGAEVPPVGGGAPY